MGYCLEAGETAREGVRRIVTEQVNRALDNLAAKDAEDRDACIHEARKAFKQIRAVLRLVRYDIGRETYKFENVTYRDAGRLLAPLRDSYIKIETMNKILAGIDDKAVRKVGNSVKRRLRYHYKKIKQDFTEDGSTVDQVIATLHDARERIPDWTFDDQGFDIFAGGIEEYYKRGQAYMHEAYANPLDSELFHEWRKNVKYLWYHVRILKPMWTDILDPYAIELKQVSDYLGDAHDLMILYAEMQAMDMTRKGAWYKLHALIDYHSAQLERAAEVLGMRIYAEAPEEFTQRLQTYWVAWQERQTSAEI